MSSVEQPPEPARPIFPRLAGGPGRMPPQEVARHQKARLEGAMVEAVARNGFAKTTLRELTTLAGVSKSTFYEHFESKEECFLATFDEIVDQGGERFGAEFRRTGDFRERLLAGVRAFLRMAEDEPAATSLVVIESLTLGAAAIPHRERAAKAFEALFQESYARSPLGAEVSAATTRAIVAGIRNILYRRLRGGGGDGEESGGGGGEESGGGSVPDEQGGGGSVPDEQGGERFPALAEPIVAWALAYQQPESDAVGRAAAAAGRPAPTPPRGSVGSSWDDVGPARGPGALEARERIVRGTARAVIENGYAALSIPAISAAASISNHTFYEHFASKQEALLAAFEVVGGEAMAATATALAGEGDRPEAIGVAIRALLEYIAENEVFARLAFFELPVAGPEALDRADAMLDGFSAFLGPGSAPRELGAPPPAPILEAIPGGIWAVIQHEIVQGRAESLAELAPEVTRIALRPFGADHGWEAT